MAQSDALLHISNIINTQIEYTVTPVTFAVVTHRGEISYPIGSTDADDGLRGFRPLSEELKRISSLITIVDSIPEWVQPNQIIYGRLYPAYSDWAVENVPEMFAEIIGEGLDLDLTPYTEQLYTDLGGGGGGGESNIGANVGTGDGIYKDKTSVTLNFKSLKAGTGITLTPTTDEIQISSLGSSIALDPIPVTGTASGLIVDTVDATLYPTVKWLLSVRNGTSGAYSSEILATTIGALIGHSESNIINIGTPISNIILDVELSSTNIVLKITTDTPNVLILISRVVNIL